MPRVNRPASQAPTNGPALAFDTETTGLDFWHGARPYFFTACVPGAGPTFWEWDVDPETRMPTVNENDAREMRQLLARGPRIVGQNIKFDAHALRAAGVNTWAPLWDITEDTLIASHVLESNQPHDLTALAVRFLGVDIEPFEKKLEKAVQEARRWCRSHLPTWAIAKKGRADMPSAKEKTWKIDAWMLRALRKHENHGPEEWDTLLSDYACADSEVTAALWPIMEAELHRRGLWEIYRERMKLVPVIWDMEEQGVTANRDRLENLRRGYTADAQRTAAVMLAVAADEGCDLELPKAGNNKSLTRLCFGYAVQSCSTCGASVEISRDVIPECRRREAQRDTCRGCREAGKVGHPHATEYPLLDLPVVKRTDTGNPSMDKEAIDVWLNGDDEGEWKVEEGTNARRFVEALAAKRKRDTSLQYLDNYERFWVHDDGPWHTLHPSLNQTGTDTLRMSSSNPNAQNIDKHPDNRGFSLRGVFGPAPGREWWPIDYENIELRIPAYESGEPELIRVFDRPDEGPYYGSYHLAIFDVLHPELFRQFGKKCKDEFASTWYQWVKNGNFAVLYGCQEKKADATYRVKGAFKLIRGRFPKMAALADRMIVQASRVGFVETIPDKTVNPRRGYPVVCSRSEYGKVLPTVPLNYHVQSTAMWCTAKAMVRCYNQLNEWRATGFDGRIVLQVHDEIVFDLPARGKRNLPYVRKLTALMEESGNDIGVPLKAAAKYCPRDWSKHEEPK